MFRDIIGHEGPLSLLKRAAFTGRIPNAYLFVGPPHVGRRTAALQLAKALNCERNTSFASADAVDCCDDCVNCRAFNQERHPDLMIVRPLVSLKGAEDDLVIESDEGGEGEEAPEFIEIEGSMIRTGQIEALIEHSFLKRVQGRYKVYLIISAETMNEAAQNRLLKTLEEPPPNTLQRRQLRGRACRHRRGAAAGAAPGRARRAATLVGFALRRPRRLGHQHAAASAGSSDPR